MIPKVIHYCWFGKNPLPKSAERCIESWKKYCPDYEIKIWNEDNFDINSNDYVKEAYDMKKYAFVTDYVRLWILYHYGGVYFDTDVELIKPIDDLLKFRCFLASEDNIFINTGLGCGSVKKNSLIKIMLDDYNGLHYILSNGLTDNTPCPIRNTQVLNKEFLDKIHNKNIMTIIDENAYFPKEYFCPIDNKTGIKTITENTYSIHWFSGSWIDEDNKQKNDYYRKCNRVFGITIGNVIAKITWYFMHIKKVIPKIKNKIKGRLL